MSDPGRDPDLVAPADGELGAALTRERYVVVVRQRGGRLKAVIGPLDFQGAQAVKQNRPGGLPGLAYTVAPLVPPAPRDTTDERVPW